MIDNSHNICRGGGGSRGGRGGWLEGGGGGCHEGLQQL